ARAKLWPIVEEINKYAEEFKTLSDDELRGMTDRFKEEIREAVAKNEARQAELRLQLRLGRRDVSNVGGDGQTADASTDGEPPVVSAGGNGQAGAEDSE